MGNSFHTPGTEDLMDTDSNPSNTQPPSRAPQLISPHLWSLAYITHSPAMLEAASTIDEERVGQLFASSSSTVAPVASNSMSPPIPQLRPPPMALYDGKSSNLRAFCSQLVNQINGEIFVSEEAKVRFAYQCLGPGALSKMRSSFRHLEDPSIPQEINTLDEFLAALRQRCQDPGLEERASCVIDGLSQGNTPFHKFITIFEDNMADSTYSHQDKSQWKIMLRRRLSPKLKDALVMAPDIPDDYHSFVTYLWQKDFGFQEAPASSVPMAPPRFYPQAPPIAQHSAPTPLIFKEPTVSQGGTAMDLDAISRQKGLDGRLTQQAEEARRTLNRCVRCNRQGHATPNCPLGSRTTASVDSSLSYIAQNEQSKD